MKPPELIPLAHLAEQIDVSVRTLRTNLEDAGVTIMRPTPTKPCVAARDWVEYLRGTFTRPTSDVWQDPEETRRIHGELEQDEQQADTD